MSLRRPDNKPRLTLRSPTRATPQPWLSPFRRLRRTVNQANGVPRSRDQETTTPLIEPLTRWTCDDCGHDVSSTNGLLTFQNDPTQPFLAYEFRIRCRPPRWVRMLASLWVRLTGMANAPSRGWGRGIWWSG